MVLGVRKKIKIGAQLFYIILVAWSMLFDCNTILLPSHVDHSVISMTFCSTIWPIPVHCWVSTLSLLQDNYKLQFEPWRNLLRKTKDWENVQRCWLLTMLVVHHGGHHECNRTGTQSHKTYNGSCYLLQIILSLALQCIEMHTLAFLCIISQHSRLLHSGYSPPLTLHIFLNSDSSLCSGCHPHLGTSSYLPFIYLHPTHASRNMQSSSKLLNFFYFQSSPGSFYVHLLLCQVLIILCSLVIRIISLESWRNT